MAGPLSFRALLVVALTTSTTSASIQRVAPGPAPVTVGQDEPQLTQQQTHDIQAWAKAEIERTVSPDQISAWRKMSNNLQSSSSSNTAAQNRAFLNQQVQPLNLSDASVGGAVCAVCGSVMGVAVSTGLTNLGKVGCTAACVGAAQAIGLGPENPLADAVSVACPALCAAATSTLGKAAASGGGAYFACHTVFPIC